MKHINKTSSRPRLAALLFGAALLGLASQSALAAGTASTTVIANMASITYDVGGSPVYICSAPGGNTTLDSDGTCVDGVNGAGVTDFAVDNKVDLLVTEVSTTYTTSGAGSTAQVTTFTVKNEGNTTQDFLLAAANLANGTSLFTKTDNFDVTGCVIALSSTTGTATFSTTGGDHLDALVADEIATMTVSCNIPAARANGDFAAISLTATARANDAAATLGAALAEAANTEDGVEIVFGDAAKAATGDTAGNGVDSDRDGYLVTAPKLTITKSVTTLCDPVDGNTTPHNIPGAVVRWTITIANDAAATSASLTTISDAIPTNTTLDPDLITGAGVGTACEYAAAGAGTPESANTRSVRIQNTNSRAMAGTAAGAATSSYFVADVADANADGVTATSATGTLSVNFVTALPAGGAYGAGELKAGETLTIYFNVGIN